MGRALFARMHARATLLILAALTLALAASCGSSVDPDSPVDAGDSPQPDATEADPFAAVTAELESSFPSRPAGADGIGLIIFDSNDERVYEHTVGDFDFDQRLAIASASKLVSGLVLMRLVENGDLEMTSSTGDVLGWGASNGQITLDQLGAFVSGLRGTFLCTFNANTTLEACVDLIEAAAVAAAPGDELVYGNPHLHVAARMAEVATGKSWQAIADDELLSPLGIASADLRYYTAPKAANGTTNPLIAGGLRATTNEYAELLALLFHRGRRGDTQLIGEALMERFFENPYNTATVGASPYADQGYDYRYGFTSWLECDGAPSTCSRVSSAGAFGFTPWVDEENGYYGILAMEAEQAGAGSTYSVDLQQRLQPLIEAAIAP